MHRQLKVLFFFLLFPCASWAAIGDKEAVEPVIDRVMELSGFSRFIEQIPQLAAAKLEQQPIPGATEEDARRFKAIFTDAMAPGNLHRSVAQHLRDNYDAAKFDALLTMLDSTLARKMTTLEVEASTVGAQKELQVFADGLSVAPPSAERVALAARFVEAAGALDAMIAVQVGMAETMLRAAFVLDGTKQEVSDGELQEMLDRMRSEMERPLADYLMVNTFFVYRGVTDDEFKNYIAMYESDTGSWMTALFNDATVLAFKNAGAEIGRGIAAEFSRRKTEATDESR